MRGLAFAFVGAGALFSACAVHDDTTFPNWPQPTETTPPVRTVVSPLDDAGAGGVDPGGTTNTEVGPVDVGGDRPPPPPIDGAADRPLSLDGGALDVVGADAGPPKSITSIAASYAHTCAVVNGGVKCWGNNDFDQLGDGTSSGTSSESLSPVQVFGLESGVTDIASSYQHTCAVVNGGLKCWGWTALGNGYDNSSPIPVQVVGLEAGVTAVACGFDHTCAVVNGGLKCWGNNQLGALGDGSPWRGVPSQVPGMASGVTAVACGYNHTCAVVNGETLCWGRNEYGQIGNGTTVNAPAPSHVVGLTASSGVSAISGGANHTCALAAGSVRCWGDNSAGQLGDGTMTSQLSCVEGNELLASVTALSAGRLHNCALASGVAKCWGYDSAYAAGGGGTPLSRLTPGPVVGLGSGVTAVSAGGNHSCAVVGNQMFCWGENYFGQLGDGTKTWRSAPVPVRGL